MIDDSDGDDCYLADFMGTSAPVTRETDVPQTILHPILANLKREPDGSISEIPEWGIVVNLTEAQVPFMDLTWIANEDGWSVDDWGQFNSLAVDEKLDLGLPVGLLIVPRRIDNEEEFERLYSAGSDAEETQRILSDQGEKQQ